MNNFNDWLAQKLGDTLGSMYFFYFCVLLDLAELLLGQPSKWGVVQWVTYLSQVVIQLIALPVLQVYQNLQNKKHDELNAKVKMMHKHIKEIHTKVHE